MQEIYKLPASEIVQKIKSGELSATETTQAALQRLNDINPTYNAVADLCEEQALAAAAEIDAGDKDSKSLAGVPITVKVNVDQESCRTTNGLKLQSELIAKMDSPVVANLKRAGAIIIGRTNTPAFSIRWFTRNSLHGHTLNPLNKTLTPGGSSGGAASAVASGIGAIAHGTDIAGSVRYPAYACGVHGLRPSLGRIPVHNASNADRLIGGQLMAVSGPLARSIDDLTLGFNAMAGDGNFATGGDSISARDPWWVPAPLRFEPVPKRVALTLQPAGTTEVDSQLIDELKRAAATLESHGWTVDEVECPPIADSARLNMCFWMAEVEQTRQAVKDENDPDANFVFRQLERRTSIYAKDGAAIDPNKLFQERATVVRQWQEFMDTYPILLCASSSELPFKDQLDVESESAFDRIFDAQSTQIGLPLTGLPALHVTTAHTSVDNQPVPLGVQLVGRRYREDSLLEVGKLLETPAAIVGD